MFNQLFVNCMKNSVVYRNDRREFNNTVKNVCKINILLVYESILILINVYRKFN